MSHLSDTQLAHLKKLLLDRRRELQEHFAQNNEENSLLGDSLRISTGELSSVDNHPADVGTETFERSRDLAINDSLEDELEEIDQALQRMEDGTYGLCVVSGEEIPYERLEAIPFTAYSVEHTPRKEISGDRPVEEQAMTRPPSGAGEGRQKHTGRFDDAQAWDSVEDYGTSNSPAMAAKRDVSDYDDM
ncbi:TraR/DksA C4-type zinc finger protein [Paenibacillus rhizophilus]|uniref:Conjugal transfer protein TraR n=1 Tax=Paenibacillus rhizophilus TaxID=1850366 RepID=A0A3N9PDL8_9BACL|nr:TraR/DksA C4-type zinc finger protein [Paenibacillus rhizophilus]RQW13630.1 conjugal transfer protein TraR [Paenibacillus rhizophilus]